jgi:hypothetical protein
MASDASRADQWHQRTKRTATRDERQNRMSNTTTRADTRALLFALAQLHQDIRATRGELMRLANADAGMEWLKNAAAIEESLRRAELTIGHSGIDLLASDKEGQL